MKGERWPAIEALFHAALELPPDQRGSYLDRACGEDATLRRQVESLVRSDEKAGDFLAHPPPVGDREPSTSKAGSVARQAGALNHLLSQLEKLEVHPKWSDLPREESPVMAGRYRMVRLLGRGGMGVVYRADDLKLGEPVALKFLPPSMARNEAMLSRFLREVKIARRITHPNVCRVYDVGEAEGHHFLSMEFIEGEDLASLMRRIGRPRRDQVLEVLHQLCQGLAAIHDQGILHCDLKPANLMIDGQGRVRITDFGVAALARGAAGAETRLGTPAYMAPEQQECEPVSVATDLYALGLVMYELLTGERAFRSESGELPCLSRQTPPMPPSKVVADIEPDLEDLILRCLEKDPGARPSSAQEVAEALMDGAPRAPKEPVARDATGLPLHQLPSPPADFTGREAELNELRKAVERGGVTISGLQGMGGVGKTALALKLAEELAPLYPDAQIYLDLRGVSPEPLTAAQAMAHVIRSFRPEVPLPATEADMASHYRSVLHGRRAVILMDNAADREQVEPLIPPRSCVLLVTSRRSLTLPGLLVKSLDILPAEDAVAFLRRIVPRIGEEAEEMARLCGYLPIALRLAGRALAERRDLAPSEYLLRLTEGRGRLELIEASLVLSYELLSAEHQKLWRALAVFPGTFDRAAAMAVWELEPNPGDDQLGELVKNGLVEWTDGRYRLHDLARCFGYHQLGEVERFDLGWRHSKHFLKVVEEAEELYVQGGEGLRRGLSLLDTEWANILAGQAWSSTHAGDDPAIARLCSDFPQAGSRSFWLRLPPAARIRWQTSALEAARRLDDRAAQAHHLAYLGWAYARPGEPERGAKLCRQALSIAREIGDLSGEHLSLCLLGTALLLQGQPRRAIELIERALAITREMGDRRFEGTCLSHLGAAHSQLGEPNRANELLGQALLIARDIGDRSTECVCLGNLGWTEVLRGEPRRAIQVLDQSLVISRDIGFRNYEGVCLDNLAWAYLDLGEPSRAIEFAEQARALACEMDSRRLKGHVLGTLGRVYLSLGAPHRAIETLEQVLVISREVGDSYMESVASWFLGWCYEEGEPARAADLLQVRVDYERAIGHTEAEAHATVVEEVKARLKADLASQKPMGGSMTSNSGAGGTASGGSASE